MEAPAEPRDPNRTAIDLAALLGLAGIVAGIVILAPGDLGFDPAVALTALFSWVPTTLPIAGLVLLATVVDIGAGVVIARALRGRPFDDLGEALLQGFVAAVVKDVLLLGLLAGFGLFSQPILIGSHLLLFAVGARWLRPIIEPEGMPRGGELTPLGVLIGVAWAAPILLQLASPVVPFLDVLPNHMAPAEHLRTFGTLSNLTDTQSPIYGPSRIFLGYTALLGTITTATGLPAGAALAGFILPSTVLVFVAVRRLARAFGGPALVPWALLTFAMTTSLARLGDARATVVVLPIVAWCLALLAEHLASYPEAEVRGRDDERLPQGVLLGLGLGAALLLHPVIGFLAAVTVGLVVLAAPERAARIGVPALGTGGVVALPQAATMLGIALPPVSLIAAVGLGIGAGLALGRLPQVGRLLVEPRRVAAIAAAVLGVILAGPVIRAGFAGAGPLLAVVEVSLVAALVGVILKAPVSRNLVLWAALATGLVVAALTQLVPEEGSGLLGQALRFELPKTLQYWIPVFVALLAAGGLAALLETERLPTTLRTIALVAFVGTAALPIRTAPIDAFHLGEHRLSETLSISMRWVQHGFWQGFPDSRYVVDEPRQEILDAVRAEIATRGIRHNTPILHVASSFQQWIATPLGVFAGVTETDATPDAVESIHTVGGRLRHIDELDALLGPCFPYVLFEPHGEDIPAGTRDRIAAAGYDTIFANGQGELFKLAGSTATEAYRTGCDA